MADQPPSRFKDFKNRSMNPVGLRRQRVETVIDLRKAKRTEILLKKRHIEDLGDLSLEANDTDCNTCSVLDDLPKILQNLFVEQHDIALQGVIGLRRLLSVGTDPPITDVVNSGAVPRLVELMGYHGNIRLQYESAWVITNIASGDTDQTRAVVESGAIPRLVELISMADYDLCDQAVWALGNVAGDSADMRALVLQSGGMKALSLAVSRFNSIAFYRRCTWAICHMVRRIKPSAVDDTVQLASIMIESFIDTEDSEVMIGSCRALSFITETGGESIALILSLPNVLPRLLALLRSGCETIVAPALNVVGNLTLGTDMETQVLLDVGLLGELSELIMHDSYAIKIDCLWALSNITAGNRVQIQAVMDTGIIEKIIELCRVEKDLRAKKEATWVLANSVNGSCHTQRRALAELGCIQGLCNMLVLHAETKLLVVILQSLTCLLRLGERLSSTCGGVNEYALMIEEEYGVERMEALQEHDNYDVYTSATELLETYFASCHEDEEW